MTRWPSAKFLNASISITMVLVTKMQRCCRRGRVKHQSELIAPLVGP